MLFYLLLLFVTVPMAELWVILEINRYVGIGWTIGIAVATGIIGSTLARRQGRALMARIRGELQAGHMPADKLIEGLLLLAGGIMLLFPGYLTDLAGFSLLIPGNRRLLREYLKRVFRHRFTITGEEPPR